MSHSARPLAPISDAARDLAADQRHLALARRIASHWAARLPRMAEEFESAALLGLVEAARSFDPSRGLKFITYATHRIVGAIKDAGREELPKGFRRSGGEGVPGVVSISLAIESDQGTVETIANRLDCGYGPVGWEAESIDAVEGLIRGLPPKVKAAMRIIYTDGPGGQVHAYRKLGVSESRASQLHSQRIAMLQEQHAVNGQSEPLPPRSLTESDKVALRGIAAEHPADYPGKVADRFRDRFGWRPHHVAVAHVLRESEGTTPRPPREKLARPKPVIDLPADFAESRRPPSGPAVSVDPAPAPPAAIVLPPTPPALVRPPPSAPRLTLASARAELDARRAILDAIDRLEPEVARRSLEWAAGLFA